MASKFPAYTCYIKQYTFMQYYLSRCMVQQPLNPDKSEQYCHQTTWPQTKIYQ